MEFRSPFILSKASFSLMTFVLVSYLEPETPYEFLIELNTEATKTLNITVGASFFLVLSPHLVIPH